MIYYNLLDQKWYVRPYIIALAIVVAVIASSITTAWLWEKYMPVVNTTVDKIIGCTLYKKSLEGVLNELAYQKRDRDALEEQFIRDHGMKNAKVANEQAMRQAVRGLTK